MDSDAVSNAAQPKPRRRWYQYSLRTLLIFVTLAGCGFAWLGTKIRKARQQQAAVAAIEKKGCLVCYDYQVGPGINPFNATLPGPAWLHALLGDDCFRNVCTIRFFGDVYHGWPVADDDDLRQINVLTRVEYLSMTDTQVTDAGLAHLQGLTHLTNLDLSGTKVTDAGMDHLMGLKQLHFLGLHGTKVTAAGVAKLQKALPKCLIF